MGDVVFQNSSVNVENDRRQKTSNDGNVENESLLKVLRPNNVRQQILDDLSRPSTPASSLSSVTQMASNDDESDDKTTYIPSPKTSFAMQPKRVSSHSLQNNNNLNNINNGTALPIVAEHENDEDENVLLRNNNKRRIRVVKQQVINLPLSKSTKVEFALLIFAALITKCYNNQEIQSIALLFLIILD